jgi:hypothetical protein
MGFVLLLLLLLLGDGVGGSSKGSGPGLSGSVYWSGASLGSAFWGWARRMAEQARRTSSSLSEESMRVTRRRSARILAWARM